MDITPELSRIVQQCMDAKYESRAEFARTAGVAKSMVTRLLSPPVAGLWLTEAVWERLYDALLPEIGEKAGPEYLPRGKWLAYLSSQGAGQPNGRTDAGQSQSLGPSDPLLQELLEIWGTLDRADRLGLLSCAHRLRRGDTSPMSAPPSP